MAQIHVRRSAVLTPGTAAAESYWWRYPGLAGSAEHQAFFGLKEWNGRTEYERSVRKDGIVIPSGDILESGRMEQKY